MLAERFVVRQCQPGAFPRFSIPVPACQSNFPPIPSMHPSTPPAASSTNSPGPAPVPRRSIVVVDDHPIIREGLALLINNQPDLFVAAQASTPAEAMGCLPRVHPNLVVTDLTMPGRGGLELIKDIWSFDPQIRTLVLTMRDEEHFAERALRAGASGYVMKSAGSDVILQAIRDVLAGAMAVSPGFASNVVRRFAGPRAKSANGSPIGQLSDRELEVFRLVGQGHDTTEIAKQLQLSDKTVDVHRANIRRKLGLRNSTALIHRAVQWVDSEFGAC